MRAHGAVTFAEGLAMSTSLTSLNLAFNGFGDLAPCSALCDALAKDTCAIVSLDLSCNRIGEKAACLIAAKGMNLSLSLERLILDKNPIGRTGCKRIMAASFGPSTASAAQADGDTSGGADGATQPGGGRAMMRARRKSDARGLEECEATVEADAKIEVSLKDCSAQRFVPLSTHSSSLPIFTHPCSFFHSLVLASIPIFTEDSSSFPFPPARKTPPPRADATPLKGQPLLSQYAQL